MFIHFRPSEPADKSTAREDLERNQLSSLTSIQTLEAPHPLTPILQTQAPFNMADGAPRRSANALQTLRDSKNSPSAGQPDTFRASSSSLFAHDELI